MDSNYIGFLFLFPIDKKYDYIIEKNFHILFKKKLKITSNDLKNFFRIDKSYTENIINNKTIHNIDDGNIIIYLIISESTVYINEYSKKIGRRTIDNVRFQKTGLYRKHRIWENHFHTTDTLEQVKDTIKYLEIKNFIDNEEEKTIQEYIKDRKNMNIRFTKNMKILENLENVEVFYQHLIKEFSSK